MNDDERPAGGTVADLEDLFGVHLDDRVQAGTRIYLDLLLKWNRAVDLVGNLSRGQLLERCFFESFWATTALPTGAVIVDVGTGGGFPGLAMKLYRPDLNATLVEPNLRKTVFLKEVARRLGLEVAIHAGRGETFPGWDGVDYALMRALKPSGELLATLRRRYVPLLLLHGGEAVAPQNFQVAESRAQPGSLRRRLSLFTPERFT